MGKINSTDILFATLTRGCNTVCRHTITGIESIAEIVRMIRPDNPGGFGIYTLEIRNSTAGWSHRRPISFSA